MGEVGDVHVCCAAAALALTPRLLARVAPPQSFRRRYTGAFRSGRLSSLYLEHCGLSACLAGRA